MKDLSLLVILGATGDLVNKKIFPILDNIDIDKITYSRKNTGSKYKAIIGDFDDIIPLVDYIKTKNYQNLYFYLSLPPQLYFDIINKLFKSFAKYTMHIALEKPFGDSYKNALELTTLIKEHGEDNFYLVDHYIAKEEIIKFTKNRKEILNKPITSVEIVMKETSKLENRGSFFDKVGIIKDTFQNHMLLLARIIVNNYIDETNFVATKGSIVLDQFDGYKNIVGVEASSETPTFFKAEFRYKNIIFKFFSAKAQDENKKFVKINFVDGTSYLVDLEKNTRIAPHEIIVKDFVTNQKKYSVSIKDSLAQWRIVESITN